MFSKEKPGGERASERLTGSPLMVRFFERRSGLKGIKMDEDYCEVKTFEQSTNERIHTLENEIKLLKSSMASILKAVTRLSESNMLHHGVYR